MIVVTVGTQKFPMNRLVEAVDKLALHIEEKIFVQIGHSTYIPKNCEYKTFVDSDTLKKMINECSVLITHAGVGSIVSGFHANVPVICVPRMKKYGEHVDDHQKEIAEAFSGKNCVLTCNDVEKLGEYINMAKEYQFEPYVVSGGKIEDIILNYIKIFS